MALTPEQHSPIAVTYESAANDESLPMQQRKAFAKKANWQTFHPPSYPIAE